MSDNAPPSERDSVIIVYRTEKRTFARVFNERSLDELKDVVRRKLGLGRETDVSLKHAGSRALLDLEDDDDFQAFCVFVKSAASVDIEVMVGASRGVVVSPPVPPQPLEQPASESTERRVLPEVDTTQVETPEPSVRKRKVSFDAGALAAREKSTERRPSKAVSAALSKSVGTEEPPKKKHKKGATKAKDVDVQLPPVVQESPAKVSDTPKFKLKKSGVSDRISEAGMSASGDVATSESVAKLQKKRKKDDGAGTKKSSAPVDRDGTDQPISQPNEPVNEVSSQPASEKPKTADEGDGAPKIRKSEKIKPPKGMVCASIPQTSASTSVRSEVAAAILSGFLSKPSEILPPEPPAKRKTVKKDTKKSSASSSALPVQNASTPANEVPSVLQGRRPEPTAATSGPPETSGLNGPRCPICLGEPFHIRYCCPTVLKGPDAIRERLEELMGGDMDDQQSVIKELEGLLRDTKVTSKPSLDVALTEGAQSREVSLLSDASLPKTPTIPTNSNVSEVTVESRSEGSSSESSDEISEGETRHKEVPVPRRQQTPDESLGADDDLEAIVRGPAPRHQNVLNAIDRILGESDSDSDSDSEEDRAELEEDNDEEIVRSRRRLARQTKRSSDSESESEEPESRSPSSSRSVEGTPNNPQPVVQVSSKRTESGKHQDGEGDVVMKDSAHPPVVDGQYDGSSEETHVGSEDRMDVDHESVEKRAAGVAGEQSSTPVLPSNKGSQGSEQTGLEPASNQGDMPASKSRNEVEVDPIEPADDLEPSTVSRPSVVDPIEAPSEDIGSLFSGTAHSTPIPGVSKRIKTRNGEVLNDEAEHPVLLGQMLSEATDETTPLPAKEKSRKKANLTSSSQGPVSTRKSPRFSSLPPATSTPAAVALLNHRSKVSTKTSKATRTPARRSGERSDALHSGSKDGATGNGIRGAPPEWEALTEPASSLSLEVDLDDPSARIDELVSSSPGPEDIPKGTKGRSRKSAASGPAGRPQVKERLFDLSVSQIPFPYSQQNTPAPVLLNGKEREESTGSEEERVVKASKKRASMPARYRSLSSLASRATTLFSPSLPMPANKSVNDGKTKKRVVEEESSSSSSSEEEVVGSGHIPRGRRAGSVLETKKRKGLLSRSKG